MNGTRWKIVFQEVFFAFSLPSSRAIEDNGEYRKYIGGY